MLRENVISSQIGESKKNDKHISAKQALLDIGITSEKQIWFHVLQLDVKDCIKIDFDHDKKRDTNSEVFVFKKEINGKLVYIKITMREAGIVCISFHESNQKQGKER